MDPASLLGALVRGAFRSRPRKHSTKALRYLTGRGKGSFANASTMLTAAGVAWGVYETWRRSQVGQHATQGGWGGGQTAAAQPASPPPIPGSSHDAGAPSAAVPPAVLRLVQLAISAARADGTLGDNERTAIVEEAQAAGAGAIVQREIDRAPSLAEIIEGVTDPQEKSDLYTLAFSIVRADESVSGPERIYLARLATILGLDAQTTARLEQDAAARIDASDETD